MDVRKYTKKVHMRYGNKAKCGAHLSAGALFTEDRGTVTCKNCLVVMRTEDEWDSKYPNIEITKDKTVFTYRSSNGMIVIKEFEHKKTWGTESMSELYKLIVELVQ